MWICLNDAFLSVVHKDCARDELLVRARRKGDIERIFPGVKVTRLALADYAFRAVVKKQAVKIAMAGEIDRITYANFKDAVPETDLHDAYLAFWGVMHRLQVRALAPPVPPAPTLPLSGGAAKPKTRKKKGRKL